LGREVGEFCQLTKEFFYYSPTGQNVYGQNTPIRQDSIMCFNTIFSLPSFKQQKYFRGDLQDYFPFKVILQNRTFGILCEQT
jgi:hypothetical protein